MAQNNDIKKSQIQFVIKVSLVFFPFHFNEIHFILGNSEFN